MVKQLYTERLVMRKFSKEDYKDAYEYLSDKDVMAYIEGPFNYQQVKKFVDLFICENPNVYALVEKVSNKVIGHVIFHPYEYENVYEIGWILNKNYQGKGYGFEISKTLIKYGFEELKLHRIFATIVSENINSRNLLEKLSMKREAVFRKANLHNGKWMDEYWYGMLQEDYYR
jgi:RimJ/RimL family protein N-acetyltransferase